MPQNAPKLPSWGEAPNRSFRLAVDWTCWTHRNTFWSPQNQTSWDYSSLFIKRSFQIPLLFGEFQLRFSSTYPFLCTSEGSFTNVTARGPLTGVLLIRSTCEKIGWWWSFGEIQSLEIIFSRSSLKDNPWFSEKTVDAVACCLGIFMNCLESMLFLVFFHFRDQDENQVSPMFMVKNWWMQNNLGLPTVNLW